MGIDRRSMTTRRKEAVANWKRKNAANKAAQEVAIARGGNAESEAEAGVSKEKWKPAPSYNKGVANRFGDTEITPRQAQKVVPRGGVRSSSQLSTESSNNTEVEGLVAPFSAPSY